MTTPLNQVLFVEDDDTLRIATAQALSLAGFDVQSFDDPEEALRLIHAGFPGVIVSDIRMPKLDGLELLAHVQRIDPTLSVILVTGHADVAMAVNALHSGAFDFLTKPFAADHLTASVAKALERRALVFDNRRLREAMARLEEADSFLGESTAIQGMHEAIRHIAAADIDVLVEGETGTGKELVARMLHRLGPRRGRSFIAVNCGALSETMAEVELFGHGTDSVPQTRLSREGQIAASDKGTLLLDEIDSMPLGLQAKLLRVLEEREVQPIGADRPTSLDLHVVATSKVDLAEASARGTFRADLYYRLATMRLRVPPLRERGDDRTLLFAAFVEEARTALSRPQADLPHAVHRRLQQHDWPGNVRELRNFAYEAVLGVNAVTPAPPGSRTLPQRVAAFEAELLHDCLARHRGRIQPVLEELGVPRKTLYDKLERYGIRPADFRQLEGP
jgi:two-component system, NtrC family, C4-dicarboxylate transport response regulator DctD